MFEHHIARNVCKDKCSPSYVTLKAYAYKSPLNGGNGLSYYSEYKFLLESANVPVGGEIELQSTDIHSVSCKKGTIWAVQEQGFDCDSSVVLGTDFSTEGLYNKPEQFQVNNMYEQVLKQLKKLV
jgi:hypothetical protein